MGNQIPPQDYEMEFRRRALDPEVADRLGCHWRNGRWEFEYRSHDELQFRKIKTLEGKYWIEPKGAPLFPWGIDTLRGLQSRPKEPLVITEGEHDCIAVHQVGMTYVISVPNGAAGRRSDGQILVKDDHRFKWLWGPDQRLIPEVEQFDRVILATDNDAPGDVLRDELAIRIGETHCWHITYPDGCKDANEVLKNYGAETLAKVVKDAKPMRPGHLVKPSDLPNREALPTYSTGWYDLDARMRLVRPELLVVTGIPGHGKGQWVRALAFRLALENRWRTAFFTPEDPYERLKRDMRRFANAHVLADQRQIWIDQHFRISHPPIDERITMGLVMAEMEAAAFSHDCNVFVLDPWNTVSHDRRGRPETEYIEEALEDLKRKARRLRMVLIIVAHPRKVDGKPDLYTINGSANWFNKCDHGVIIYRDQPEDKAALVIVEKCKDHETMGTPGEIWMIFDKDKADYFTRADG